ncbi:MAG: hypothetical protein IJ219_03300 [Bacteroidaceae bacterium]|nr:hypothetical protein [Bacteroidaceae bacterium]
MLTTFQQQYIAQWHDGFMSYVGSLLGVIAGLVTRPEATREDKEALEAVKMMLTGKDAEDVERDLSSGIIKKSTLDKIEKINGDLVDTCLAHIQMNPLVREFCKQMMHIQITHNRRAEAMRLQALHIPIIENL